MKFFKPEDFELLPTFDIRPFNESCAMIANDKLEREGKVVYGGKFCLDGEWSFVSHNNVPPGISSHKALLVCIEPIEKCKHEASKVRSTGHAESLLGVWYQCSCGAHVKP